MPFNSISKTLIRKTFNKSILKFLYEFLGDKKLIYLGLPSEKALDIKEWIEFLGAIYAFQCRDHKDPESNDRTKVIALGNLLRDLKRENSYLKTPVVWDGFIEEVIFRGVDRSPQQI